MIYALYVVLLVAVVYLSMKLGDFVDLLDKKTNVSGAFIGGVLLAAVTSLPELFTKNLEKAYKLYLKDEFARKTEKIMNKCDKIFYKNEEVINNILKEYASTLEL